MKGFDAFGPYGWEIGKPIDDQLRETLGSAGICVVLLSDKTLLSPWVFFELGAAIGGRKRLVLVYLSDRAWRDAPSSLRRAASIHATTLRPEEVADRVVEAAKAA